MFFTASPEPEFKVIFFQFYMPSEAVASICQLTEKYSKTLV